MVALEGYDASHAPNAWPVEKVYDLALLASDPVSGAPAVQLALPDAEGRFAFSALRPGKYRIAAQPSGAPKARWIADAARMVELDIPGGSPTTSAHRGASPTAACSR